MQDFLTLGPAPYEESCVYVGEDNYEERARAECRRFIAFLRSIVGPEPAGARLSVKSFPHDFGDYMEVVCYFNADIPESVEHAYRCEEQTPATWEG